MPLATVTQGPTPPSGRSVTSGELVIRFDEPYADGVYHHASVHHAEYDTSTGWWKPLGEANGVDFRVPAGADGYPQPPAAWLVERLVLDDATVITSRRGPMRIVETSDGVWSYAAPAPGTLYLTDGIDEGGGSGDVSEGDAPYFASVRFGTDTGPRITGSATADAETLRFMPNAVDGTGALTVKIDAATGKMTIQNGIEDTERAFLTEGDGAVTIAALLAVSGASVKVVYRSANARWELPDGTVPDLTGRAASLVWEGTSAQIPAQGTGDSDFQEGDTALVRSTSL